MNALRLTGRLLAPLLAVFAAAAAADLVPFVYTEGQTSPRSEVRDPCIVRETHAVMVAS